MSPEERIALAILRLRHRQAFFGALALFAEHRLDPSVQTAATDGQYVIFNPVFVDGLRDAELQAVLVHELLHAALLHCPRRGERDGFLWNIAADIVVNGILRNEPGLTLPMGACVDANLENYEVEEVYELLRDRVRPPEMKWIGEDLLPPCFVARKESHDGGDGGLQREFAAQQAHWKQAWQQASTLLEASGLGRLPSGLQRNLEALTSPQLDWRSLLWRFLVRTPVDFSGFDRRLIGRGLYLEALEGETISVQIAVDTSGSVSSRDLALFLSEVRGIVRLYPHLKAGLFYADCSLHGPFAFDDDSLAQPECGGGTSFEPFFEHVRQHTDPCDNTLLIYLTDGYGSFPSFTPEQTVLWVVTPGGLPTSDFPFGEVARLRD